MKSQKEKRMYFTYHMNDISMGFEKEGLKPHTPLDSGLLSAHVIRISALQNQLVHGIFSVTNCIAIDISISNID